MFLNITIDNLTTILTSSTGMRKGWDAIGLSEPEEKENYFQWEVEDEDEAEEILEILEGAGVWFERC